MNGGVVMNNSSVLKQIYKFRAMYLLLLPAVVFCLIFNYRPMIGVIMAFQNYDLVHGMFHSPFVGLANFKDFLANPDFYNALKNTLGLNFLAILFGFPLPIIMAIIISSMKGSIFKKVSQTISYLPHFISWIVVAGLAYKMLDVDFGIVNVIIKQFGGQSIAFMREEKYFWFIIVTVAIWKELGWNTIIYLASLSGIDVEQYEAATVDGATGFQKLIYITLPGLAPTIALMLIFTMGSLVSGSIVNGNVSFDAVYNMRNALVSPASDTLEYFVYQQGVMEVRYGLSTAIGLSLNVVSLTLVMFSNFLSRRIRGYGAF